MGQDRDRPDLAIAIVITSGGINKEAYKRLQIPEVWFWEKGQLSLHTLQTNGYVEIKRSEVLPKLDIALLTRCINMANHAEAIREFRRNLRTPYTIADVNDHPFQAILFHIHTC